MERYTIFMDWKINAVKMSNSLQPDLQIQFNTNQITAANT